MKRELYIRGKKNFYLRSILFSYEKLPIIFVSEDNKGTLYLCECTDSRFGKLEWTIAETNCEILEKLLNKEMTIFEAMKSLPSNKYIVSYDVAKEEFVQIEKQFNMLEEGQLPEPDAFLEIVDEGAKRDIEKLKKEKDLSQMTINYDVINHLYSVLIESWEEGKFNISYSTVTQNGSSLTANSSLGTDQCLDVA